MTYFRLFVLLYLFTAPLIGICAEGNHQIDSIKRIIQRQSADKRIESMVDLGWQYYTIGHYHEARKHLFEAIRLAKKKKQTTTIARARHTLGIIELNQSNYQIALMYLRKVELVYLQGNDNTNLASVYNDLGVVYFRKGDYNQAVEYYKKALKMNQVIGNEAGVSANMTNIGGVYYIQGKMEQAIVYCFQSLQLERKLGNKKGEISSLTTIAITYEATKNKTKAVEYFTKACLLAESIKDQDGMAYGYLNFGDFYSNQHQATEALRCYQKSLYYFEELGDQSGVALSLSGLGKVASLEGHQPKALEYMLQSLRINESINNKEGILKTTNGIARIYLKTKNIQQAVLYGKQALSMAVSSNNIEEILAAHAILSEAYEALNQTSSSLYHYKRTVTINDSLSNLEMQKSIQETQAKYHTQLKEQENKKLVLNNQVQSLQLEKTNYFVTSLVIGLIVIVLFSYLLIKRNKLKHQREEITLEQQLLRTQMNPHFLFNALTAIESFIYKNEPREAGNYLSKFARLMRLILENSKQEYISLEKELQTLEYYFNLQQLRYDNSFAYSIEVDELIDQSLVQIPPMLAQPFIENAIEHGLIQQGHRMDKGEINIRFSRSDDALVFEISDNGVGFDATVATVNGEHVSMATEITLQRLKNLNRLKFRKIQWIRENKTDPHGTVIGASIVFTIPYILKSLKMTQH